MEISEATITEVAAVGATDPGTGRPWGEAAVPDLEALQADLFPAVHRVLMMRLRGRLETVVGMAAWNELIDAHDAVADAMARG